MPPPLRTSCGIAFKTRRSNRPSCLSIRRLKLKNLRSGTTTRPAEASSANITNQVFGLLLITAYCLGPTYLAATHHALLPVIRLALGYLLDADLRRRVRPERPLVAIFSLFPDRLPGRKPPATVLPRPFSSRPAPAKIGHHAAVGCVPTPSRLWFGSKLVR